MEAISTLRADHAHLRQKMLLMDSALQVGPEARFVLREMSFSLLHLLQDHMHREADALAAYYHHVPSGRFLLEPADHAVEYRLLKTVNELLLTGVRASLPLVILRLSQALEQLRAQIESQEQYLFSTLEQAVGAGGDGLVICPEMSVNEILSRYPQTRSVFEHLNVDRFQDGYESVDEIAWRRGLEVSGILEQLRQAVAFSTYA